MDKTNPKHIIDQLQSTITELEFKLGRTLQDKDIMKSILNQTIKELEEKKVELEEKKSLVENQSKIKELLFANVNHELRTPLNAIIGMSHMLGKTSLSESQGDYVRIINQAAENLLVIINDFLTLSKLNAGELKIKNELFSMKQLFNDLNSLFSYKANEKKLNLKFNMAYDLPESLIGDKLRINQILVNLISNAIKFTHAGFISVTASLKQNMGELKLIEIEVTDTGIGIPKTRLQSIFDSFVQAHETSEELNVDGTGLGLNIVKNLIAAMHGNIEVESEVDQGTTFKVELPLKVEEREITFQVDEEIEILIPERWKEKNILLIEDNPANIIYATELFRVWGLEMDIRKTIRESKEALWNTKYDLVLSDVRMPDGNGLELIQELRATPSAMSSTSPVLVLTASISEAEKEWSNNIAIAAYIEKPFKPELLYKHMYLILGGELPLTRKITSGVVKEARNTLSKVFSNNEKAVKQMMQVCYEQLVEAEQLQQLISDGQYQEIEDFSHKLKSTLKIINSEKMLDSIDRIESAAGNRKSLDIIQAEYDLFWTEASEFIKGFKN